MNETVPQEIELKFALGKEAGVRLPEHPRLVNAPCTRHRLANTYYDTPDRALEHARIALRLRRDGEHVVQTVKTAGQGRGGLHERGEWEWALTREALDLDGLAALGVAVLAQETVREALAPVYRTDFERHTWQLAIDPDNAVEVAFDQGEIVAGTQRTPIFELELELKGRDSTVLWQLADQLADSIAMRPANTSKAERAVALRQGEWTLPECRPGDPERCLARAITALDAWTDTHDTTHLFAARQAFETMTRHDNPEIAALASRLAAQLNGQDWLDSAFGRMSLDLLGHVRKLNDAL